ncbi:hypothetical protein [Haloarchaeobius sp. HRN-SO-5]|uniref:hypothetical protein n=1 Tax=Haloarchaeobius sp. HRN-SO-5 TaxID=3446118 RepID=UPI003EC0BA43
MSGHRSRAMRSGDETAADGVGYVAVSNDGVEVRKAVRDVDSSLPVVRYELASSADDEVKVVLRDTVPESLSLSDVGFHADYAGDQWRKTSDGVEFRCLLDPGEQIATVYGIRTSDLGDTDAFQTEPALEVVTSTGDDAEIETDSGASWEQSMDLGPIEESFDRSSDDKETAADGATTTASAGTAGGGSSDGGSDDEEDPMTLDLDEPNPSGGTSGGSKSTDSEDLERLLSNVESAKADLDRIDALVKAVAELRSRKANVDDLKTVSARVEELGSDVASASNVERLTTAAKELDERKADASTVTELDERVDARARKRELEELQETVSDLSDRVAALEDRSVEAEELESATDRLATRIDALHDRTASEKDLRGLKTELKQTYVTNEDVKAVIESRFRRGLGRITLLGLGGATVLSSAYLGEMYGPELGGGAFAVGALVLVGWWYLG